MKELDFTEKRISGELIYDGIVLHVFRDEIEQSTGMRSVREFVKHNGAVCVIPVTNDGEIICVRQYRYAQGRTVLEIPAGKLDTKDEIPEEAAKRELREETGFHAGKLTYLGIMQGSPAILDERIHMYLAEELEGGECEPDEDEILEIVKIPLDKLLDMVMNGEIQDAKTQIAVLKTHYLISNKQSK